MLTIRKAQRIDLPAISYLLNQSGKMSIQDWHLNKRDIALQARDENGVLIGFIWCGLMCEGRLGYIDKFVVDQGYWKSGVGNTLAVALLQECLRRKVRQVFGCIKCDAYHEASAMNALKLGMGADPDTYTYVSADVQNSFQELQALGR